MIKKTNNKFIIYSLTNQHRVDYDAKIKTKIDNNKFFVYLLQYENFK